jgi:hypothetical protein
VDFAKDCYIELDNAICCEKHNPLVIFQFTKEYRNKAIANQILRRPLFEKNIDFVQKKNSVLMASDLKNARELRFKLGCIDRQFPSRNLTVRPGLKDARQQKHTE